MRRYLITGLFLSLFGSLGFAAEGTVYRQQEDVVFAQVHGIAVTMDIFTPVGEKNGIGIVDVASGAWSSDRGKIRDHKRALIYDVFCKRGYTVFAVRPGSISRFSGLDMKDHIERGIRWIKTRSDEYKIDPNRLGLMGASAGGHLASLVAVSNGQTSDEHSASVAAVGVFFPPTDLIEYGDKTFDPRSDANLGRVVRALAFRDGVKGLSDEAVERGLTAMSPARLVTKNAPPFLLIHGDADEVVPLQQSQRLMNELKQRDVPVELIVKKGGGHPWLTIPVEVAKMADWFDRQLASDRK
jgi:acetyl esterase/lipase